MTRAAKLLALMLCSSCLSSCWGSSDHGGEPVYFMYFETLNDERDEKSVYSIEIREDDEFICAHHIAILKDGQSVDIRNPRGESFVLISSADKTQLKTLVREVTLLEEERDEVSYYLILFKETGFVQDAGFLDHNLPQTTALITLLRDICPVVPPAS